MWPGQRHVSEELFVRGGGWIVCILYLYLCLKLSLYFHLYLYLTWFTLCVWSASCTRWWLELIAFFICICICLCILICIIFVSFVMYSVGQEGSRFVIINQLASLLIITTARSNSSSWWGWWWRWWWWWWRWWWCWRRRKRREGELSAMNILLTPGNTGQEY